VAPTWRITLFAAPSDQVLLVVKHLRGLGFQVLECQEISTRSASIYFSEKPDLLLLISQPENFNTFLKLISALRSINNSCPIFHLHNGEHFSYRVKSLQEGADDVLSIPYALEELDARLEALLRRSKGKDLNKDSVIRHADLVLNKENREITRAKRTTKLTVREYDLFMFLLQRPGQTMPRKAILEAIWGQTWTGDDNLLEVYIRYLRKKVERPGHEKLIETVRGVGYMLR